MADAPADADIERALAAFPALTRPSFRPLGRGLINHTFAVESGGARYVLQRLSPIFSPAVNRNIRAVTAQLRRAGLVTPVLLDSADGRPWVELGAAGCWRLMTWVDGASFDAVQSPEQARSAGELVARFHAALADLDHRFEGLRARVHDLDRHVATLRAAVASHPGHRLHAAVAELARGIFARVERLSRCAEDVVVIGHGDLKLNNIRFAGAEPPERDRAISLIDLDTVAPMPLGFELGDAWRSWCNPGGEDAGFAPEFDRTVFAASLSGYRDGLGRPLTPDERRDLLDGVEQISIELAARFAADALAESYFGWDPSRHPGRGEHNLHRARVQMGLHDSVRKTRAARAELLEVRL